MNYEARGEAMILHNPGMRYEPAVRYEMARSYTLRDFIGVIRTRFHWILAAVLVASFLGGSYAMFRDRYYEASNEIYIDPKGLEIVDRDVTRQTETTDGNVAWIESQMRIMTSSEVLNEVIESENLAADPEFAARRPGILDPILTLFGVRLDEDLPPPSVLSRLSEAVSTYRPERSYVVELYVRTRSAEKSARLADAIARAYLASAETTQSELARRASASLTGRAEGLRAAVTEAGDRVEEFRAANDIVGANGALVSENALAQTNSLLTEASRNLSEAQARRDQVRAVMASGGTGSIPEAVTSPAMAQLRARHQAAVETRTVLAAELLPRHPRMRAAEEKVAETRAAVDAELGRIAEAAEADYQRALAVRADIEARLAGMEASSFATNEALVRLRELQRDLEAKRTVYTTYLQRATELAEQEQLDLSASRIISFAQVPREPIGPRAVLILLVSVAAGLLVGLVAVLLGAAVSASYRTGR